MLSLQAHADNEISGCCYLQQKVGTGDKRNFSCYGVPWPNNLSVNLFQHAVHSARSI